jgi:hypothetical protein
MTPSWTEFWFLLCLGWQLSFFFDKKQLLVLNASSLAETRIQDITTDPVRRQKQWTYHLPPLISSQFACTEHIYNSSSYLPWRPRPGSTTRLCPRQRSSGSCIPLLQLAIAHHTSHPWLVDCIGFALMSTFGNASNSLGQPTYKFCKNWPGLSNLIFSRITSMHDNTLGSSYAVLLILSPFQIIRRYVFFLVHKFCYTYADICYVQIRNKIYMYLKKLKPN